MLIKPPLFTISLQPFTTLSFLQTPKFQSLLGLYSLLFFFFVCGGVVAFENPPKKKNTFHVFCYYRSVAPMKFGKRLKQQIQETLPGWRDKFLSYKELKKLVRSISSAPTLLNGSFEYGRAEEEFVYLLNNEIEKFNAFFVEQEEDFVIRNKVLFVFLVLLFQTLKQKWKKKLVHFYGY